MVTFLEMFPWRSFAENLRELPLHSLLVKEEEEVLCSLGVHERSPLEAHNRYFWAFSTLLPSTSTTRFFFFGL